MSSRLVRASIQTFSRRAVQALAIKSCTEQPLGLLCNRNDSNGSTLSRVAHRGLSPLRRTLPASVGEASRRVTNLPHLLAPRIGRLVGGTNKVLNHRSILGLAAEHLLGALTHTRQLVRGEVARIYGRTAHQTNQSNRQHTHDWSPFEYSQLRVVKRSSTPHVGYTKHCEDIFSRIFFEQICFHKNVKKFGEATGHVRSPYTIGIGVIDSSTSSLLPFAKELHLPARLEPLQECLRREVVQMVSVLQAPK